MLPRASTSRQATEDNPPFTTDDVARMILFYQKQLIKLDKMMRYGPPAKRKVAYHCINNDILPNLKKVLEAMHYLTRGELVNYTLLPTHVTSNTYRALVDTAILTSKMPTINESSRESSPQPMNKTNQSQS
jgi:hypothetical protein